MENRAYAFVAGFFALLMGAALALGFWWLSGSHRPESEYDILSHYPISGLNPQAAVRYRGVDVGRVREITFDQSDLRAILIHIRIDRSIPITRGSYAKLVSQGLTGLSYIELDDTDTDKTPIGNGRIPLRESDMRQLMNSGKDILDRSAQLLERTDQLMKTLNTLLDEQNTQKINRLITNIEQSSAELAPLLKSSRNTTEKVNALLAGIHPQELSDALTSIKQASLSIKETSDSARPALSKIQHSLDEFERIGRHIEQSSTALSETLDQETLPRVHELADQLHRDAQSLNRLVDTLEQHPQSLIYGKPQPQPGPGEKGFRP